MADFVCIDDSDSIVYKVVRKLKDRQHDGYKKYGVTMDRKDLSIMDWINHAQEEAMDFVLYLEKIKTEIRK